MCERKKCVVCYDSQNRILWKEWNIIYICDGDNAQKMRKKYIFDSS